MKYTLAIAALFVLSFGANAIAEEGHVSQSQLAEFGLAGMDTMSDVQGDEIRGQGFAFAGSLSASGVPGAFNISPAAALGSNEAVAISGSSSSIQAEGLIFGIGGFGAFFGGFEASATVSSAGFAYAASN